MARSSYIRLSKGNTGFPGTEAVASLFRESVMIVILDKGKFRNLISKRFGRVSDKLEVIAMTRRE